MKNLYTYYLDCGRMGTLDGVFIAEDSQVDEAIGHDIYWGEVLGKHSEIYHTLEAADIELKSSDQAAIDLLDDLFGSTISGFNPIDQYLVQKEEGQYD